MRIRINDLVLRYIENEPPNLEIERLDFECPASICGWGGSGKSSLFKVLCGVELIEKGEIYFDDIEVGSVKPIGRNVALISTKTPLFLHKSVRFNLEFPLKKRKLTLDETQLSEDFRAILDVLAKDLSENQRAEVVLLRAKLRNPDLILIDEPMTICQDVDYFLDLIKRHLDLSKVAIATFDIDLAKSFAPNPILLSKGKLKG